ncbi:MAG: alpha-galactosidase, partial [Bacteroidetes bacterium]|nr:alpha-galactosidase [Bacteroidota bacterium]
MELKAGGKMISPRTHELLMDSYDRERRGMMIQRMYAAVAPWKTQNPVFMHLISKNDQQVRDAIDQCKATGYEALVLSFGSHCDMEDTGSSNIARWKQLADYAHQQGILIGSYSLFSSLRINDE